MKDFEISLMGKKLTGESGILKLMDDIGKPLPPGVKPYRLGGGNPARIPEIESLYRARMESVLQNGDEYERLIGLYDSPQGRVAFIEDVAECLSKKYGWKIGPENVAITNGSQSAFFYLFNLFGGSFEGGRKKKIVLPLLPEYIGYADQGLEKNQFVGIPSTFTFGAGCDDNASENAESGNVSENAECGGKSDNIFKYNVDFAALESYLASHDDVGALCASRPTNPTGNVLTDDEVRRLSSLAREYGIPLIIDNAYGLPWPDIIFTNDAAPYWDENVILSMSLSKIGLPSLRTGIIIADARIVKALSALNAIAALASGSVGQAIAGPLIKDGTLIEAAQKYVRPFYKRKSEEAQKTIREAFAGTEYAVHKSEGSIFLWLYMKSLKIPTMEFYSRLKERGVIVVPGEYFFFGEADDGSLPPICEHPHYTKCLRLNYAGERGEVDGGIKIIAELYKQFS